MSVLAIDGGEAGRLVRTLVRGAFLEAGARSIEWDGRDDAGSEVRWGVYFCRITSERGARMTPMILRR
jgi:flagellar hook assembly protein FlgD